MFLPYTQFKKTKRTKEYSFIIDDQNKDIGTSMNWKRYLFGFDSHYCDQKLTFVYNQKRNKFLANEIFVKIANIINDDYLRYGKNININDIFNEWTAKTDNSKLVTGYLADYQKLNLDEKMLMTLVQFNNRLFIRSGIEFYTCI